MPLVEFVDMISYSPEPEPSLCNMPAYRDNHSTKPGWW